MARLIKKGIKGQRFRFKRNMKILYQNIKISRYMYIIYIKKVLIHVNVLVHQKSHMFCIQTFFGTAFLRQCYTCIGQKVNYHIVRFAIWQ